MSSGGGLKPELWSAHAAGVEPPMLDSPSETIEEGRVVRDIEDSEGGTCKLWGGRVANRRISDVEKLTLKDP